MAFPSLTLHILMFASGVGWAQETASEPPDPAALLLQEATDPEYNLELPLTLATPEARVVVRCDEQPTGERLELAVTPTALSLARIAGEAPTLLAGPVPLAPGDAGTCQVTLRRRLEGVSVLVGARSVLAAWAETVPGKLSVEASEGALQPDDALYQPYAPPEFTDDFMRGEADSTGEWQVLSGTWANTALIDKVDFAPRAANSFAFSAQAAPSALAVTGLPFWDDLRCSVALRLNDAGRAGLGFRVRDAANHYAFTMGFGASGAARLELARTVDGVREVLAAATRGIPLGQWYCLAVVAQGDQLQAFVDETPVLQVRDSTFAEGQLALLAENCEAAYFDDAQAEECKGFEDDFERADGLGRWQVLGGKWTMDTTEAGTHLLKTGGEKGLAVAGCADWCDYELRADVKLGRGAAGLCVYAQSPTDYLLWRIARGRQELVRVTEAGEEVLDEAPLVGGAGSWTSVTVRAGRDYLSAVAGGGSAVEALIPSGLAGRVGLWADRNAQAGFDNVRLTFPPGYVPAELPQTMVSDVEMKEQFANPAEGWFSITDEAHQPKAVGMNWNKGEYFDPVDVTVPLSGVKASGGKVTVKIEGDQANPDGDYQLTIAKEAGSPKLTLQLTRQGQALGQAECEVGESDACVVRLAKRGSYLAVYVDEGLLIHCRDRVASAGLNAQPSSPERVEP